MRGSSYKVLTGKVLVFSRTGRNHYWAGNVNTEVLREQYKRLTIYMGDFLFFSSSSSSSSSLLSCRTFLTFSLIILIANLHLDLILFSNHHHLLATHIGKMILTLKDNYFDS